MRCSVGCGACKRACAVWLVSVGAAETREPSACACDASSGLIANISAFFTLRHAGLLTCGLNTEPVGVHLALGSASIYTYGSKYIYTRHTLIPDEIVRLAQCRVTLVLGTLKGLPALPEAAQANE